MCPPTQLNPTKWWPSHFEPCSHFACNCCCSQKPILGYIQSNVIWCLKFLCVFNIFIPLCSDTQSYDSDCNRFFCFQNCYAIRLTKTSTHDKYTKFDNIIRTRDMRPKKHHHSIQAISWADFVTVYFVKIVQIPNHLFEIKRDTWVRHSGFTDEAFDKEDNSKSYIHFDTWACGHKKSKEAKKHTIHENCKMQNSLWKLNVGNV